MTIKDVPERPDVERTIRTGYPKEPRPPRCPMCGAECESIFRRPDGEILGCENCVEIEDSWLMADILEED